MLIGIEKFLTEIESEAGMFFIAASTEHCTRS